MKKICAACGKEKGLDQFGVNNRRTCNPCNAIYLRQLRRSKKQDQHCIYALIDPRDNAIKYIGRTENIKLRVWTHINEAKNDYCTQNWCKIWIRELLKNNLTPDFIILEEVDKSRIVQREQYWIKSAFLIGAPLTNAPQRTASRKWFLENSLLYPRV